jgi:uncharacterized RDD family membrane protein YckC
MNQENWVELRVVYAICFYFLRSMFMKCPKCGFVSFDDLIQCKKCGAQLKDKKVPDGSFSAQPATPQQVPIADTVHNFPPNWHATIKNIKKELEAIEGSAVDRQSHLKDASGMANEHEAQPPVVETSTVSFPPAAEVRGGFLLRMLAYMIDCIILYAITLTLLLAGFIFLRSGTIDIGQTDTAVLLRLLVAPYMIASTIIEAFYFTYCFAVTGQTIGKWICGLRVVNARGELLGFKKAFFRWLGYLVSRFFLYAGFIWVAFSSEKRGWHDTIAGSYVIRI